MKRLIGILMVVLIMTAMVFPMSASATAGTPYSHYDAWFQASDEGCAAIYRCSCNPVDNYLYASARVQYSSNGSYKYTSWKTESGTNVTQKAFVKASPSGEYVNYVEANFKARCGSGSIKSYSDTASR